MNDHELIFPAIEVQQGTERRLYTFAVDGKQLPRFASISRISRPEGERIEGYQRPEVLSHIKEIKKYIESESPMIPNAIVLAFDDRVTFVPSGNSKNTYSRTGEIHIPVSDSWKEEQKPAWVVDGQQRMAAIREASIESFPICVTGFIAQDIQQQREQFILVNSTKPLAKGLIYELLPATQMVLPEMLAKRRFPSLLLNYLNYDADSPFRSKIKTATNPGGVIQDNSVLKMIEHSLSDGALYRFRDREGGGDVEAMLMVLKRYWSSVATVFNDAWELPPTRSRLVHGAGIVSMGFVMDAISDRHHDLPEITSTDYEKDLMGMGRICRWTHGYWEFGGNVNRKWNEIQNTTKDIRLLANHLLLHYRTEIWIRPSDAVRQRSIRQN